MDYITATESAIHHGRLSLGAAADLRHQVSVSLRNFKPPTQNLTKGEKEAVERLGKDKSITLLPADKGRMIVVMDTEEYNEKRAVMLSDTNTYEVLKRDPTNRYRDLVISKLKDLKTTGVITEKQYFKLYPSGAQPPTFYGLPKVHKKDYPLRPITSSRGTVMYPVAKHVAGILRPLVGKTEHHVKNIQDFVSKIKDRKLEEGWTITSGDVVSLYTCIPIDGAISAVRELLEKDSELHTRTGMSVHQICDLVEMCLSCSYFLCDGKFYKQKHGCAMGSPLSPIVVNIYMERFEQLALRTYQGIPPNLWVRYVDDTYIELMEVEEDPFFEHINTVDPNIKFTKEPLNEQKRLAFLDAGVSVKLDGAFGVTVYRKPTHTNQYLLFDSHHPLDHKLGVVRTLFHRANTVVTDQDDRET